jgi:hypothetical protein
MYVLNCGAYLDSDDNIVRCALPRLSDAVATILYGTNPKCLDAFLDPDVKIFEWRRSGNRIMIRREGSQVIVGTYGNFGTKYVWTYFVRSEISASGAWTQTYGAVNLVTTPVSADKVHFDEAESEPSALGISSTDPKYALYVGRELGYFLLCRTPWRFNYNSSQKVEWQVDGVTYEAVEFERRMLREQKEENVSEEDGIGPAKSELSIALMPGIF